MTDRAKKISELQATTSVANTDKLVVLKDPSGTPLTRSATANVFALSIGPIARLDLPGAVHTLANTTATSNGTSNVTWLSVSNTYMFHVLYTAVDQNTGDKSIGEIFVAANTSVANSENQYTSRKIGSNPVNVFVNPAVNSTIIYMTFNRDSSSTANVKFNYRLTTYPG
jgi:hypothetical protein